MDVYLRAKFEVSSIILTGFRQGVILLPPPTSKRAPKKPTQIRVKVGDNVRISKYKKNFAKGYTPNWSKQVFVISKIKNTVRWTYVINDLNDEEIFMKKNCKRLIKKNIGLKRWLKEMEINYMSNGKVIKVYLIVGLIKKI